MQVGVRGGTRLRTRGRAGGSRPRERGFRWIELKLIVSHTHVGARPCRDGERGRARFDPRPLQDLADASMAVHRRNCSTSSYMSLDLISIIKSRRQLATASRLAPVRAVENSLRPRACTLQNATARGEPRHKLSMILGSRLWLCAGA